MNIKVRLIMGTIRVLSWPRRMFRQIFGGPVTPPTEARETVLLYRGDPEMIEFARFDIGAEKIIEQFGIVGDQAPRSELPGTKKDMISDTIEELLFDDYQHAAEFDGTSSVQITLTSSEQIEQLEKALHSSGLGMIESVTGDVFTVVAAPHPAAKELLAEYGAP